MLEALKVLLLASFIIKKKKNPLQIIFVLDLILVIPRCRIVWLQILELLFLYYSPI